MQNRFIVIFFLIVVCAATFIVGELTLSPSDVAMSCPGEQLTLRCSTNETYLEWSVTDTQRRLVSFQGLAQELGPLTVNSIIVPISRISDNGVLPLVSTLSISNVTKFNRTVVNCSEIMENGQKLTSSTNIHLIATAPTAPNVQQLVNFTRDTITVVLEWTPLDKVSYSITLVPDATTQGVVNGTIQLSLAYNRLYNFSIVATLCGRASAPTIIRLKYGKCGFPLRQASANNTVTVAGYSEPAIENTTVTFTCPSGLILTGPNTATCMRNGEWEPDPRDVMCKVDCGVPLVDCHIRLNYNSTSEGSLLTFRCEDGLVPYTTFKAVCHKDTSWTPNPVRHVCASRLSANCGPPSPPENGYIIPYTSTVEGARVTVSCPSSPGEKSMSAVCSQQGEWEPNTVEICTLTQEQAHSILGQDAIIAIISSAITFILSSAAFFVIGYVCRCSHQKTKNPKIDSMDKSDPQLGHHNAIYEDIKPKSVELQNKKENVELSGNVAYTSIKL